MRTLFVMLLGLLLVASAAQAATVQLSWTASPTAGVTGYRMYYGTATGTYTVNQNAGLSLTGTIGGLTDGVTYYMAVKAYNASGTESVFSNEVVVPITVPPDPPDEPGVPPQAVIMPRVFSR